MPFGPSSVPIAANSLTSPAPVAPTMCHGSMSNSPTANPTSAAARLTGVTCNRARTTPVSAMPIVSGFGTRRVLRSTRALTPPLAATAAITIGSKILNNGLPEHRLDDGGQRRQGSQHEHRDQHGEEPVLEQVLSVLETNEPANRGAHNSHSNL